MASALKVKLFQLMMPQVLEPYLAQHIQLTEVLLETPLALDIRLEENSKQF